MRIPISVAEGLLLANSLISGTETKKILDQWREKHSMPFRLDKKQELGKGYWRGFMTRNSQLITSKRGVKFESKRADDWCIYLSFSSMYDEVYKEWPQPKMPISPS
jgi:hypothetical protein